MQKQYDLEFSQINAHACTPHDRIIMSHYIKNFIETIEFYFGFYWCTEYAEKQDKNCFRLINSFENSGQI